MAMSEFVREVTSNGIRFRWFTCHCTEIKLPNGKYIVIDPFLPESDDDKWGRLGCGYSVDDIEGCDYIVVNHAHDDHILQIGKLYNKFHPRVLVHANTAIYYSQTYGITERDIFPFESHDSYDFGDFRLETSEGRHNDTASQPGKAARPVAKIDDHATQAFLGTLGSMFNTNLLFTLPDGEKIGFSAGSWDTITRSRWRDVHPNILFRHRTYWRMEPRELAEIIADIGCEVAIPWHHNNAYDPSYDYDFNAFCASVNKELADLTPNSVLINPERGKWYEANFNVSML